MSNLTNARDVVPSNGTGTDSLDSSSQPGGNRRIGRIVVPSKPSECGGRGGRRGRDAKGAPSASSPTFLKDFIDVVSQDFSCMLTRQCDGGGAAFDTALAGDAVIKDHMSRLSIKVPNPSIDQADSENQQEGETGIEFDEEEILRRDYELNRV